MNHKVLCRNKSSRKVSPTQPCDLSYANDTVYIPGMLFNACKFLSRNTMRKWTHIWYFSKISVEHFHVWHDDGKQTKIKKQNISKCINKIWISVDILCIFFPIPPPQLSTYNWERDKERVLWERLPHPQRISSSICTFPFTLLPSPCQAPFLPQKRDPPLRRSSEKGQAGSKAQRLFLEKRPNAKERKRKEGRGWLQALSASYRPMACFQRLAPCPQG